MPTTVWAQLRQLVRARVLMGRHAWIAWRQESPLKRIVLPVLLLLLWVGWYAGCARAFGYLLLFPGLGPILVDRLFALMFGAVFAMLIASTVVTALTTLYQSTEVGALLVYPVDANAIFLLKAMEVSVLASWAPLFFVGPVVLAYGVRRELSWSYYAAVGVAVPWLLLLACAIGLLVVLAAVGAAPRLRWGRAWLVLPLAAALWFVWLMRRIPRPDDVTPSQATAIAESLFRHTAFMRWPCNPSYWLSECVQAVIAARWSRAVGMGAVLFSTALLAVQLAIACARRMYYAGWSRLSSWPTTARRRRAMRPRRARSGWPWRRGRVQWLVMAKDARLFVRDPAQWSHVVIFFGMLAVYVLNLRTLPYNLQDRFWQHMIGFLNLAATTLTMAMLNVRFIFPQLSLEGRRAWVMRLAPVSAAQVLQAKWWAGVLGSLLVTELLVIGSSLMLRLTPVILGLACGIILMMCCAVVGLAVGLGARYPELRQENPARIISGFGGTLLLVLTLAYVGAMMSLGATPLHWWVSGVLHASAALQRVAWIFGALALALSVLTAMVPWRIGLRQAQRQEF